MKNIKNIILGLVAFLSYFIISNVPVTIMDMLNIDYMSWSNTAKNIYNIFTDLFIILFIFLLLHKTIIPNIKEFFSKPKEYLSDYIKYWFIALGLMYVSNFILILINGNIAANEQGVRSLLVENPILTFILASILAPVLEEFVFRLSLYKIIKHKYMFIILSGLIFGGMHVLGSTTLLEWLYIIPYGIPGCVFAYTLVKSDNICVPISLHFIHNTFAIAIQLLAAILM